MAFMYSYQDLVLIQTDSTLRTNGNPFSLTYGGTVS